MVAVSSYLRFRHAAFAGLAATLASYALVTAITTDAFAQEAKMVLEADEARNEAPASTGDAASTTIAPRHDIVGGTGPNAVVPPITRTAPVVAAKSLFGAQRAPAPLAARAIGFYSKGCLAGAVQLPVNGTAWQAMRLSRNRNWGHPSLIAAIERLANDARKHDGWPGLLVGDMSQPRGGPMLTGHNSHQIGLDADIWLTPMPARELTRQEREDMSAISTLAPGHLTVDPKIWTPQHAAIIKRAAGFGDVERVLVHPAIKKAICEATPQGPDRGWLAKVRPVWGHFYHFHVRLGCPKGMVGCLPQSPVPTDDGCGKELDEWYQRLTAPPQPPGPPQPPKPPMTLEQLPAECRLVLAAEQPAAPVAPFCPPRLSQRLHRGRKRPRLPPNLSRRLTCLWLCPDGSPDFSSCLPLLLWSLI